MLIAVALGIALGFVFIKVFEAAPQWPVFSGVLIAALIGGAGFAPFIGDLNGLLAGMIAATMVGWTGLRRLL